MTRGIGIFSAFAFVMTGIFPIDSQPAHSIWSVVLFGSMGVFLITSAITLAKRRPGFIKPIGYFAIANATVIFVFGTLANTFVLEWLGVGMFIIYLLLLSYNLRKVQSSRILSRSL